jgi:hypothetical protein
VFAELSAALSSAELLTMPPATLPAQVAGRWDFPAVMPAFDVRL